MRLFKSNTHKAYRTIIVAGALLVTMSAVSTYAGPNQGLLTSIMRPTADVHSSNSSFQLTLRNAISVNVDGKMYKAAKNSAVRKKGKVLLNAQTIAKAFKATYSYKKTKKTVRLSKKIPVNIKKPNGAKKKKTLTFTINQKKYKSGFTKPVNKQADIATTLYAKKPFVSAHALTSQFGYAMQYIKAEKTLFISRKYDENKIDEGENGTDDNQETPNPSAQIGQTPTPDVSAIIAPNNSAPGLESPEPGLPVTSSLVSESPETTSQPAELTPKPSASEPTPSQTILRYSVFSQDFEENATFFTESYGSEGITPTQEPEGADGSDYCLKFGGKWTTYRIDSGISLAIGEDYVVSFYAKGGVYKVMITDDTKHEDVHISGGIGPENWQQYEITFTAGTDVTGAFSMAIQTGEGECYLDEYTVSRLHNTEDDEEVTNPLPRMEINAPEAYQILGLGQKYTKVKGDMSINDGTKNRKVLLSDSKIKLSGRGNSTFGGGIIETYKKRPLKFTFRNDESKPILGMPAGHKWNLMADMYDRTLMRNCIAQNFAKHLSYLEWQPATKHIELYINGEYYGVYLLTEAIDDEETKLNINTDLTSTDEPGFIAEWDSRAEDEADRAYNELTDEQKAGLTKADMYMMISIKDRNNTWYDQEFGFKEPEPQDMTAKQRAYIKKSIQDMSTAVGNMDDSWDDLLDVNSFIDFYMVNDIYANYDACSFASVYLYKRPNEKIKMGPCWDYDIYLGNNNTNTSTEWITWGASPWLHRLINNSTSFRTSFYQRWVDTNKAIYQKECLDFLEELYLEIKDAAKRNFDRWPVLDKEMFGSDTRKSLPGTYEGEVDYLRNWLTDRGEFIDSFYYSRYRK